MSTFTVTLTQEQLHRIVASLEYYEKRVLFLARLAERQGREREALARHETAAEYRQLARELEQIAAREQSK